MNRASRRHPTNYFLPIDQVSKKVVRDNRKLAKTEAKAKGYVASRRKRM